MEFLKKHFEKILLSIVLLGLAGAAAFMPIKVSSEREKMDARKEELLGAKAKRYELVNLSTNEKVLRRFQIDYDVKLSGPHNLFNPVKWQKRPDGSFLKIQAGTEVGAGALQVSKIDPLHMTVTFDDVRGEVGGNIRYQVSVTRETDRPVTKRPGFAAVGGTNNLFALREIKGPAQAPEELVLVMAGDKEPITNSKANPHKRIIAYSADLKYEPENLTWKNLRIKGELSFGGETYNIVAIDKDEVVLSAKSNRKKTTVKYSAAR